MKIVDINSIPNSRRAHQSNAHPKKQPSPEHFQRRKRWWLYGISSLVTVAAIVLPAGWFYQEKREAAAQNAMFQAVYCFETSDFDKALLGDETHKGFLHIIKAYPYTPTANLAYFYIGTTYMHQKAYEEAITFLSKFHAKDFILQPRAWCVMGDAYSAQSNYKQAVKYYIKAAHYKSNSIYTPNYLVKAAIAFEADQCYKEAYHCYQEIVEKYPKSQQGRDLAIKEASRLSTFL